jgi:hypothetical protein
MFKLFKKRAAPVATPEKPKAIDWASMWQSFINAQNAEIREPVTLAQMRLDGHAKDRGAVKGMRMYNEHKTKLQNQWVNPLQSVNSGFGNAQFAYYNYQTVNYFQCYQLAQDPLFTKVFNMLSNTPFSKGGQLTQPDGAELDEDAIEKAADRYHLWEEIRSAVRSSYVAGGCLIYLDFGQTEEERGQPLRLRKANMRKFVGFKHIDAINITAVNVNTIDPTRQDYMKPDLWYVIGLGVVHRSHFLHFEANPPELPMRPLTLYFGMPLTQLIKQDIANSNLVSQGVANLINRSRLVYLTADDTAFATDNAGQFRARLEWMSMVQDNFGVAPLKQGETVQQLTTALTGFAENVEQCYLLVSAKTDIPFTELMGKSASGMNATGEGDRRKWYDKCRTIQESVKREILTMYGIVAGKIGDGKFVEFPDYVFNPLEEATEKELAENIKAYTEVANGLVGLGADPAGVVEWLKSFKQFNLEEIDFDTSAPGLEGYDDDTDPDGTPGGGLPREDITPKVLEAVRAMNASEKVKDWRSTDTGAHFPIKEGQTVKEALDDFKKKHKKTSANPSSYQEMAGAAVQESLSKVVKQLKETVKPAGGTEWYVDVPHQDTKLRRPRHVDEAVDAKSMVQLVDRILEQYDLPEQLKQYLDENEDIKYPLKMDAEKLFTKEAGSERTTIKNTHDLINELLSVWVEEYNWDDNTAPEKRVEVEDITQKADHPLMSFDEPKGDTGFNRPDGDGSSGAKIRVVVKPVSDITNARKEMFTWYRNNLQGKTVVHPKLGEIKFSRKGGTHSMHGASEEKIVLIPHIKEIISTGTTDGWEPLKHPRDDGFAEFAVVRNTVAINGKDTKVGCFIAKDVNGKIYYDLFINKAADSYIPEDVVRANNGLDTYSMNKENEVVNIFILS